MQSNTVGSTLPSADPLNGLFSSRIPTAAARQTATVLAWLTECQLATLEGLQMRKSTPKSQLRRQEEICITAVDQCLDLGIGPDVRGLRGHGCPRLSERLRSRTTEVKEAARHNTLCSTGIRLAFNYTQEWAAQIEYSTWSHGQGENYSGEISSTYSSKDLSKVIDRILALAESMGVTFPREGGVEPHIYVEGDGENLDVALPEDWREIVSKECMRLGWQSCYQL